ncbi:MAG: rod shape-determining protein MreC [Bacteroidota bacterium]
MRNLILFFIRFNALFLFLLLEIIALFLLVQREPQKEIFLHSSNIVSGSILKVYDGVVQYTNLRKVNANMAEEIAWYKNRDTTSFSRMQSGNFNNDSTLNLRFEFIPAHVINNSTSGNNNYLTLDKGTAHGVVENTGVVGGTGIVGIVRKASSNYAAVMSVLHREIKISALLKRNNYFGSLVWKDNHPRIMDLDAIPKHVEVEKGDSVVTSGFSTFFPPGQMIGIVDTAWVDPGENFYTIKVELSCDLGNVQFAYVVKHQLREEQKDLEEEVGYE